MMTKFIYEQLEKAEKDYLRFDERGNYYYEQRNFPQALANYLDSFSAYADYIEYAEGAWKARQVEEFTAGQIPYIRKEISYSTEDKIDFYFNISTLLLKIIKCLDNQLIEAYIDEKIKILFEASSNYQKEFNVQDIESFNELAKYVQLKSKIVAENKETLEEIKKVKPEQEQDETLKKIRKALVVISRTKICVPPLEAGSDSSCFIATAAYSTPRHPDLDTFRNFRDEKLLTNAVGKQLVNFYYEISPSIAQYVEKQPAIKSFLRHQLEHLAQWMRSQTITNK